MDLLLRTILTVGIALAGASCASGGGDGAGADDGGSGNNNNNGHQNNTPRAAVCVDRCSEDAQCPAPLTCEAGSCTCEKNDDCVLQGPRCEADTDCDEGRCVAWNGTTLCAQEASIDPPVCGTLLDPQSPIAVDLADGSGTVSVCPWDEDLECRNGECIFPCGTCNFPPTMPHCDSTSGKCVCTTEPTDSCADAMPDTRCLPDGTCGCAHDNRCFGSTPKCDLPTGRCICESDDDCGGDPCIEGVCSCTDDAECQGTDFSGNPIDRDGYPDTPSVCEPL